ncbi:SFRP5 (predicted), partial [Pycnogonum litorale]
DKRKRSHRVEESIIFKNIFRLRREEQQCGTRWNVSAVETGRYRCAGISFSNIIGSWNKKKKMEAGKSRRCFWMAFVCLLSTIDCRSPIINDTSNAPSDYYSQWTSENGRSSKPMCVNIPETMRLCHGIGYNQMRLPNLLGHDTISEVVIQAKYWVALLNLKCHPDTQLFLCSLFSPVCLDRPIYPCRSLCDAVRNGCESRMNGYGYPWPDMVRCDKFPLDNDMCISVQSKRQKGNGCEFCNQVMTNENILDNFCRSDFVVKAKLKKIKKSKITFRKGKVLKLKAGLQRRKIRRPTFLASNMNISHCCQNFTNNVNRNFIVMGKKKSDGPELLPTFIVPWQKRPSFKNLIRMFKKFDCTNPSKMISESLLRDGMIQIRPGRRKQGGKKRQR